MTRFSTNFFTNNTRFSPVDEVSSVFNFKGAATEETHQIQLIVPVVHTDTSITDLPWYSRLNGCFICYDMTDKESFIDIEVTYWYEVRLR